MVRENVNIQNQARHFQSFKSCWGKQNLKKIIITIFKLISCCCCCCCCIQKVEENQLNCRGISEFESLRRFLRFWIETVLLSLFVDGRRQVGVLLFRTKVSLDDVERLLVDFHVFVRLQELDLVQT